MSEKDSASGDQYTTDSKASMEDADDETTDEENPRMSSLDERSIDKKSDQSGISPVRFVYAGNSFKSEELLKIKNNRAKAEERSFKLA